MNAIETQNLTKRYKEKTAVNNLNLTVREGELYGLLGVNGAGKSTTIKMLSTLTQPTGGDAQILGNSIISDAAKVKEIINVRKNLRLGQAHSQSKGSGDDRAL